MQYTSISLLIGLNPYCSGQWSRTVAGIHLSSFVKSLNPYCSGQWSRTHLTGEVEIIVVYVLILIVVDNGLVPTLQDIIDYQ